MRAAASKIAGRDWVSLFSVFGFAWAFQALEEKSDRLDLGDLWSLDTLSDLGVIASALVLLLRPGSPRALFVFAGASLFNAGVELPRIMNHIVIASCLNALVVFHLGRDWLSRGLPETGEQADETKARLLRKITPAAQILVAQLYAFAFFHKLNWDFVDVASSCVGFSYLQTSMIVPFLPPLNETLTRLGIGLTYALELGIPVLLLIPRTRALGLILGVLFHLGLGAHVPSFTILLYVLYLFFVPPALFTAIGSALQRIPRLGAFVHALATVATLALLASWYALYLLPAYPAIHFMRWSWLAATIPLVSAGGWLGWRELRPEMAHVPPRTRAPFSLMIFALVALNAMGPYLGIKTGVTFSMYSNLRTAGVSNHMLIPKAALQIVDAQDDLVEIVRSSDPHLAALGRDSLLARFELRRMLGEHAARGGAPVEMTLRRGDETYSSTQMERDPFFAEPIAWPLAKLMIFRPVPKHGGGRCSW